MVHCANFWKWFVAPGFLFLLEKIIGIAVSRMGGLYIVEVNLLPSKVRSPTGSGVPAVIPDHHVCDRGWFVRLYR